MSPKISMLVTNLVLGPFVGFAVMFGGMPMPGLFDLLPPIPGLVQIFEWTGSFFVVLLGLVYIAGLTPALLNSCFMMAAMRTGASPSALVMISIVSGYLATALIACVFVLFRGGTPSLETLRAGYVGMMPAAVCTMVAIRLTGRKYRQE
ncbi:hypothetical protein EV291_10210 [Rhizobium sp. BK068]|nr:hypothetical protein EV291_10210 [Rhizobium sp. BK068]